MGPRLRPFIRPSVGPIIGPWLSPFVSPLIAAVAGPPGGSRLHPPKGFPVASVVRLPKGALISPRSHRIARPALGPIVRPLIATQIMSKLRLIMRPSWGAFMAPGRGFIRPPVEHW